MFGVTRFSDEMQEEFNRRYKGRKGHGKGVREGVATRRPLAWTSARMERKEGGEREKEEGGQVLERPTVVDWVAAGATTSVENQGQCGVSACLAFPSFGLLFVIKLCYIGLWDGWIFFLFLLIAQSLAVLHSFLPTCPLSLLPSLTLSLPPSPLPPSPAGLSRPRHR